MTRLKNEKDTLVDIVEVGENAQHFFERYKNWLLGGAIGIVAIAGGLLAYIYLYKKPLEKEAMEQMFQAEYQFSRDSFARALINPGNGYEGFLDLADHYSGTKAGNLAKYYSAVSHLQLGQTDAAISFLNDFKPAGDILPIMKYGLLGDAYSEKQEYDKAIDNYKKAVNEGDNDVLTSYYMFKLGRLYEYQGDTAASLKMYQEIKSKYPSSTEGQDIDKYIARLSQNG